jgi:hypothetical protein
LTPKLKANVVVKALLRRCDLLAIPAAVVRRGDADSGAILIKLNQFEIGSTVLAQTRTLEGELVWMRATGETPVADEAAEAYIERQRKRDPDLWVVEIEDRAGRLPLDQRVL